MFSPIRMEGGAGMITGIMPLAAGAPANAARPTAPAKPTTSATPTAPAAKPAPKPKAATAATAATKPWLPAPEVIEAEAVEWSRNPGQMSLFRDLEKIFASSGMYRVKRENRLVEMTPSEAVSFLFWQKAYAKLTAMQRAEVMRTLVREIGPRASRFHAEILITAASRDVREVADAIEQEARGLPQAEIAAGKRDAAFLRNLDDALHARHQAELGGGAPNKGAEVTVSVKASDSSSSVSDRQWAIAPGVAAQGMLFGSPIGARLTQASGDLYLSADWMSGNRGTRAQPFVGVYGQVSGGSLYGVGARAGFAHDWMNRLGGRYGLGIGYLRLNGEADEPKDTPVDVTGITPDRRAYVARKGSAMDRTFQGATLMANVEADARIYRPNSGPFSLNGFLSLSAGLIGGSLSDDGCSYTVSSDDARAKPQGDGYVVSSPKAFGSRCRSGEFSLGGAVGLAIGVRGEL